MSRTNTILDLPTEILQMIAYYLDADAPSIIWLRSSCQILRSSIPPPTHAKLIEWETAGFGLQNDLYACRDCLILRPKAKFGDKMTKKEKAKWGLDVINRWCVECGIKPLPGTNRYTAGNHIQISGEHYVICLRCRHFGAGASADGKPLSVCQDCQHVTKTIEERRAAGRARQERDRLRAEQTERRARRCAIYGSDSDSDDIVPPSPTFSEEQMDMIQLEANSPGAGSD